MKWTFSHATDNIHHWHLQKEKGTGALSFNLQHLSLRLSGSSKRVFFLRLQGLLQKKVLLHSEYGAVVGETAFAENPSAGQIVFDGQKLFYQASPAQLCLFTEEKQHLATCEMPVETTVGKLELYGLLFGLAWFLTADVLAEKERMLAVTV